MPMTGPLLLISWFVFILQCFDSFIVVASFIVDLVFLKGLQQFTVQEFVLILAFMVPWRIIRVVNSKSTMFYRPYVSRRCHVSLVNIAWIFPCAQIKITTCPLITCY